MPPWSVMTALSNGRNTFSILVSREKLHYLLKKSFENFSVHFVTDSIFKRLKFDFSSSAANKVKRYFLGDCVFLEIRRTYVNQLLQNIMINKWVTAISNLFK